MEVKKQEDEEEEVAETQGEGKALGKMGKGQPDGKTEEKPEVRLSALTPRWMSENPE